MVNKGGTLLDGVDEAFSFPLIDQFRNYAWTEVRFDKAQYEFIRERWLYLVKNLAARQPISMPASRPPSDARLDHAQGDMAPDDRQGRQGPVLHGRRHALRPGDTKACDHTPMGLVGFHIVHKLEQFPEWIWSSFEQVDNVERGPGAAPNYADLVQQRHALPSTTGGWANRPKRKAPPLLPVDARTPAQVTRLNPIPNTPAGASTRDLNRVYQGLLRDTVWRNYQLVITQWPTNPGQLHDKEKGGHLPPRLRPAVPRERLRERRTRDVLPVAGGRRRGGRQFVHELSLHRRQVGLQLGLATPFPLTRVPCDASAQGSESKRRAVPYRTMMIEFRPSIEDRTHESDSWRLVDFPRRHRPVGVRRDLGDQRR